MKKLVCLLLLLSLLPMGVFAENVVINRTDNLTEEYVFEGDTPILEIFFPRVYSSDCAIVRFGDEIMMIDSSTESEVMQDRIHSAMDSIGADHVDVAFNTHPHRDHINGFAFVNEYAPIGKLVLVFPEDYDNTMIAAVDYAKGHNIPIEHVENGDVMTMGENEEVKMHVIHHWGTSQWNANDQSAMLMIQYGERRILFTADVENRAQVYYAENPPACGLDADILKYPHHGLVGMKNQFYKLITPELALINGAADVMDAGKEYMAKKKIPYLLGYKGITRMRTDGNIWVVDYVYELRPDRDTTIQPEYR